MYHLGRDGHNGTIRLRRHCIPGLFRGMEACPLIGESQINLISFQNKLKLEI